MDTVIALLQTDLAGTATWIWLVFAGLVVALLAFDLGVLHKDDHVIGVGESLVLSAGYIGAALAFGGWVWWMKGAGSGIEYFTGFLIEKALSMDNVFVIALIFGFFAIPPQYQHRVLFWGILGVIVLRAILIGLGATLVSQFSWILYLFGAFLVVTGWKLLRQPNTQVASGRNPILRLFRRFVPVSPEYHGQQFFVRRDGRWLATPLVPVLIVIGTTEPPATLGQCAWRR